MVLQCLFEELGFFKAKANAIAACRARNNDETQSGTACRAPTCCIRTNRARRHLTPTKIHQVKDNMGQANCGFRCYDLCIICLSPDFPDFTFLKKPLFLDIKLRPFFSNLHIHSNGIVRDIRHNFFNIHDDGILGADGNTKAAADATILID